MLSFISWPLCEFFLVSLGTLLNTYGISFPGSFPPIGRALYWFFAWCIFIHSLIYWGKLKFAFKTQLNDIATALKFHWVTVFCFFFFSFKIDTCAWPILGWHKFLYENIMILPFHSFLFPLLCLHEWSLNLFSSD